jgi:hypothetical protein
MRKSGHNRKTVAFFLLLHAFAYTHQCLIVAKNTFLNGTKFPSVLDPIQLWPVPLQPPHQWKKGEREIRFRAASPIITSLALGHSFYNRQ